MVQGKFPANGRGPTQGVCGLLSVVLLAGCAATTGKGDTTRSACQCGPEITADTGEIVLAAAKSEEKTDASSIAYRVGDRQPAPRLEPVRALAMLNEYREDNGLPPVNLNTSLTTIAKAHAEDLAQQDRVSHTGSDGASLAQRLERGGYDPVMATENISAGQRNFEEALDAWQESASHKLKLLTREVSEIGIAYVYDPATEYRTFWIMIMAEPF